MKTTRRIRMPLRLLAAALLAAGTNSGFAQVTEMLHSTPTGTTLRDNYAGAVGCKFQVGGTNVVVSHIGVYDPNNGDPGLTVSHQAGILDAAGATLLGGVVVPAGTSAYLTNHFRWMPLDPPMLLNANATYCLAGMVGNGDGDGWQDVFTPTWNARFVGISATTTRHAMYGPGSSTAWPPPSMSQNGNNNTYGNVMLGYIEVGPARVGVQQTSVAIGDGQTLSVTGFAAGQSPISYQWYLAPNTPAPNQTNATLVISNATVGASGAYYLTATNALGGEQSANVTVSVTSYPVGVTQSPTNMATFALYPVTFSCVATGTPSIYYQWLRNGSVVPGATNASLVFTANPTNNGDVYSCVASNYLSSGPHTQTSGSATLTVAANFALPQTILHGARAPATNSFSGTVGGLFTVGKNPALVTHLGYYASQFTDTYKTNATLSVDHHVGIFSADAKTLYASVVITAGTHDVINGYMWAPLDTQLVLSSNTRYLLVAETFAGMDPWGDSYAIPDGSPYYVTDNTTFGATYWSAAWPASGTAGQWSGQMYSAPNLAVLAPATPTAWAQPTTVTQYVGLDVTLTGAVAGQPPVLTQWYKAAGTSLNGQTNLTLHLTNLTLGQSGGYFLLATNPVIRAGGQSSDATVTVVPDVGPSLDLDIQPQEAWLYSQVTFAAAISGTPPISYQWTFNNSPIAGATGSTLTLPLVSAASAGNYQLIATNAWGSTNTSAASLTVDTPAAGSYPRAVMGPNLLAYYRFTDLTSGTGIATNQGTLGFACNGAYEGSYFSDPGPTNFSNFEPGNLAVWLDGYSADVRVPPLNVTVTNFTLAAWVYQNDAQAAAQVAAAGIAFVRGTTTADDFGLAVTPTQLTYAWNNNYWSFVTGLALPTNQWTFVAMVITPTNATVYMQDGTGMKSTNNPAAHQPATFSAPLYIGRDSLGGATGRRWSGDIDEVMVFNTALSPTAINALYQGLPAPEPLTLTPAAPGQFALTWTRLTATLLQATNIAGPWTPIIGATSPYTVTGSGAAGFYRLQMQ